MGAVVAGAGSLLGGLAGQALMGNHPAPSGGGTPGLFTSVGSGKNHDQGTAVQVNPETAIGYFTQAASKASDSINTGVSYYKDSIDQATKSVNSGYAAGNATLAGLSDASTKALAEEMRMLGLDPIQQTANSGNALKSAYAQISDKLPTIGADVNKLATAMDLATNIKDPTKRASALSALNDQYTALNQKITDYGTGLVTAAQQKATAAQNAYNNEYQVYKQAQADVAETESQNDGWGGGWGKLAAMMGADQYYPTQSIDKSDLGKNYKALVEANQGVADAKAQQEALAPYQQQFQDYASTFADQYSQGYDAGYTPDQIINKVTNLPGYQFQFEQGTQGIARQAAASGMGASANTQLALQSYGQQQAQTYYNQYLGYLNGLVQTGAPATGQISANQINQGNAIASLQQSYGQAQLNAQAAIANYQFQSYTNAGNVWNQDAIFNATAQNAAISQMRGEAARQQLQNTSPAMLQAQNAANLANASFLNGINNSNAYGQGFGAGGGTPSSTGATATSSGPAGSMSFPVGGVSGSISYV